MRGYERVCECAKGSERMYERVCEKVHERVCVRGCMRVCARAAWSPLRSRY